MASTTQQKNIVSERIQLLFKQFALQVEMDMLQEQLDLLSQQELQKETNNWGLLWEEPVEPEYFSGSSDYEDDEDTDEPNIRITRKKKINKYRPTTSKKITKQARAGKITCRSRSHLHQERDYGIPIDSTTVEFWQQVVDQIQQEKEEEDDFIGRSLNGVVFATK